MQNILLTSKGVLKIADFGMAREYSPRPLTPGIVTIWYRSPELLLGAKHYSLSVDLWSAGLILAELLLCVPCLPGETVIEQLTLIVKLLGTPTGTDLSALSAIGCPDLISWRRESLAQGRVDNIERRFLSETTKGTIEVLKALLKWDPKARWSAAELLGKGRGKYDAAARADSWWEESPREVGKEMLPTFPEVRNKESPASKMPYRGSNNDSRNDHSRSRNDVVGSEPGEMIGGHGGYVFDFDDGTLDRRAAKRHRAR
ncbi:MAG: hypothetical protein M1827_004181 [Pycnora praestabilis]|nr:MAG: hypothetical protein M1827_004181 [Pycnora praestabilis]